MKGFTKIYLVAISILILPVVAKAQYCNYFHTSYCTPSEDEMYKPNGQSKSALFSKGQTSELSVIVYKGQDYRFSLCMDENLGSQITFKVYETKKVKVEKVVESKVMEDIYDEDGNPTGEQKEVVTKETKVVEESRKELLYDNSADNYATELEFTVETTRRLTLEISIPDAGGTGKAKGVSQGKGKLMKSSEMGCVGILIEHMTTPKQGFYGTGF
ncbi:MAG: hypothetical protein KFKLKKLM_01315 [Flavobacteriales bacterium]|nr:hypothetical protein [Flavobacteriales bacterium]